MLAFWLLFGLFCFFFAVGAVWIVLAAPNRKRGELAPFLSVKYAHRGLHGNGVAENSLSAFRLAVERGYGIELDVRLAADGVPVVFHDDTLKRVCSDERRVLELTSRELAALSIDGTAEGVPTFAEVLALVNGQVPLLVEIKEEPGDSAVSLAAAALLSEYCGPYLVESFNPFSLSTIRKHLPTALRGQLSQHFTAQKEYKAAKYSLLQLFLLNGLARPDFIAYRWEDRGFFPFRLLRALFRVPAVAWTVRSPEAEAVCKRSGFATVIFEGYLPEEAEP